MNRINPTRQSVFVLLMATAVAFVGAAPVLSEPLFPVQDHPLPPDIPAEQVVWEPLYEVVGGPERVAIVVWHDPVADPPNGLYGSLQSEIDQYAADVATTGFTAYVVKFYGEAVDYNDPNAPDLRKKLRALFEEEDKSLAGAVLIGNVPYALFENSAEGADYPSDPLIGDLYATIADEMSGPGEDPQYWWHAGAFDRWDGDRNVDVWISRIIARPCLYTPSLDPAKYVPFPGQTQEGILSTYFARNHATRFNAFNSTGKALLYVDPTMGYDVEVVPYIVNELQQLFDYDCHFDFDGDDCNEYLNLIGGGWTHVHMQSHGDPQCHLFSGLPVMRADYVQNAPRTMSWYFDSCHLCDFAYAVNGPCVGEVVVFDPSDPNGPLVGFGSTDPMPLGTRPDIYYSVLADGKCLGEGFKALVNMPAPGYYARTGEGSVLLGDGTLKRWGEVVEWTGEGDDEKWHWEDNWSLGILPMDTDIVLHETGDVIEVDVGTEIAPEAVLDYTTGDDPNAGLTVLPSHALRIDRDATFGPQYRLVLSCDANSGSALLVGRSLSGGNFTLSDKCTVQVGDSVPGRSEIGGDWLVDGSEATTWFASVCGSSERALHLTLKDGAHFDVDDLRTDEPLFPSAPGLAGALVYDGLGNGFQAGTGLSGQSLYVGTQSWITRETPNSVLTLDLLCGLAIASSFSDPSVYSNWDTRSVDIIAQPIAFGDVAHETQRIELVSPVMPDWYHGDPLVFMDVPCHGGFQDLILPDWDGDPSQILPTVMADDYDNTAPSWTPGRATGFFRDIYLGKNRILKAYTDDGADGVIRCTGTVQMDDSTYVYLNDTLCDTYIPAIDYVVGTIYGDWDGDCAICNAELAGLQNAIAGQPRTYDPLMDFDCDGTLNNVETVAFLANMVRQPSCTARRDGGKSGGAKDDKFVRGEDDGAKSREFDEPFVDLPALAEWLAKTLSPEDLAKKIEELTAAAEEFAGTPVGEDLANLVYYLKLQ